MHALWGLWWPSCDFRVWILSASVRCFYIADWSWTEEDKMWSGDSLDSMFTLCAVAGILSCPHLFSLQSRFKLLFKLLPIFLWFRHDCCRRANEHVHLQWRCHWMCGSLGRALWVPAGVPAMVPADLWWRQVTSAKQHRHGDWCQSSCGDCGYQRASRSTLRYHNLQTSWRCWWWTVESSGADGSSFQVEALVPALERGLRLRFSSLDNMTSSATATGVSWLWECWFIRSSVRSKDGPWFSATDLGLSWLSRQSGRDIVVGRRKWAPAFAFTLLAYVCQSIMMHPCNISANHQRPGHASDFFPWR